MAKDPAFLFYYQDFLVGTSFMTNEETGAYIKCLCHLADKGEISREHMIKICNDKKLFDSIKDKFQSNGSGKFFNKRLTEEVEKRKKYVESRKMNRIGKNISLSYDTHMENVNDWDHKKVVTHIAQEFEIFKERSKHEWVIDLTILSEQFGVDEKVIIKAHNKPRDTKHPWKKTRKRKKKS